MGPNPRIEGLKSFTVRQYINSSNLAVTVKMLRSTFAGSFLLLEGEWYAHDEDRLIAARARARRAL